jgi:hypothetical protein
MVFAGLSPLSSKEIEIKVKIELSEADKSKYIFNSLNIPVNFIQSPDRGHILKEVILTFSIFVRQTSVESYSNHLILKEMSISDTNGSMLQ